MESLSAQAEGRPVSEVLTAVLQQSGYERMLRTEGSQGRLDNLAELKQAIYTYETTCGERSPWSITWPTWPSSPTAIPANEGTRCV